MIKYFSCLSLSFSRNLSYYSANLLTELDDKLYLTQRDIFGFSCLLFELTMGTFTEEL